MITADTFRLPYPLPKRGEAACGQSCPTDVNVGEVERMASKVGGGTLVAVGLMRGGLSGLTMAALGGALIYRGVTGHCSLYQAIGADTTENDQPGVPAQEGVRVEEAVTINRPADDLYRFWRDYANLPKFMRQIASVTAIDGDPDRSHWVANSPVGGTVEWDAEIIGDEPGRLIAWQSVAGADLETAGSVHFDPAPGGRGTEVRVNQKINPPGGQLGVIASKVFGADPASETRENLRRFKQLMETGEIPTVQGQPTGRRS